MNMVLIHFLCPIYFHRVHPRGLPLFMVRVSVALCVVVHLIINITFS